MHLIINILYNLLCCTELPIFEEVFFENENSKTTQIDSMNIFVTSGAKVTIFKANTREKNRYDPGNQLVIFYIIFRFGIATRMKQIG